MVARTEQASAGMRADLRVAGIMLCVVAALGLAAWRLLHPPIAERMEQELANGRQYITMCQFHEAYDAFRRAAALDGTEPRALRGMSRAAAGIGDFGLHRRHGKGCSVSLPGKIP